MQYYTINEKTYIFHTFITKAIKKTTAKAKQSHSFIFCWKISFSDPLKIIWNNTIWWILVYRQETFEWKHFLYYRYSDCFTKLIFITFLWLQILSIRFFLKFTSIIKPVLIIAFQKSINKKDMYWDIVFLMSSSKKKGED